MYIQLKKGKQENLIKKAINKSGSYRSLEKSTGIPKASLYAYRNFQLIPENRLKILTNFLEIKNHNRLIDKKFEENWKQKLGGKMCVKIKKRNGTFEKDLSLAQKNGAQKIKDWHKNLKQNNPRKYYLIQYEKFKKIGGYKFITKKGEKVRNILEKQTADYLYDNNISYEYEPLIEVKGKYFFPDFLIDNKIIIECTMWKGEAKAYKLKEKISFLKDKYNVFVLIPKHLNMYYKTINHHLIYNLDEIMTR